MNTWKYKQEQGEEEQLANWKVIINLAFTKASRITLLGNIQKKENARMTDEELIRELIYVFLAKNS